MKIGSNSIQNGTLFSLIDLPVMFTLSDLLIDIYVDTAKFHITQHTAKTEFK